MGASVQKQNLEEILEHGDVPAMLKLIDTGFSVNCRIRGRSPLYFAVKNNRAEMVELLLAHGANTRRGYIYETPLHLVAVTGNADIASKLLEREVNVNARNNQDATPLWLAAGKGHYDVVRLLLQHPYIHVDCPRRDALIETTKSSPLCQAVCGQHLDICKELLAHRASVDLDDVDGCTPLHHACRLGNADIASELIQHGCSLDCVDKLGYTPLHTAVSRDQHLVAQLLIQVVT